MLCRISLSTSAADEPMVFFLKTTTPKMLSRGVVSMNSASAVTLLSEKRRARQTFNLSQSLHDPEAKMLGPAASR